MITDVGNLSVTEEAHGCGTVDSRVELLLLLYYPHSACMQLLVSNTHLGGATVHVNS